VVISKLFISGKSKVKNKISLCLIIKELTLQVLTRASVVGTRASIVGHALV
jgi:hypothetical protein